MSPGNGNAERSNRMRACQRHNAVAEHAEGVDAGGTKQMLVQWSGHPISHATKRALSDFLKLGRVNPRRWPARSALMAIRIKARNSARMDEHVVTR